MTAEPNTQRGLRSRNVIASFGSCTAVRNASGAALVRGVSHMPMHGASCPHIRLGTDVDNRLDVFSTLYNLQWDTQRSPFTTPGEATRTRLKKDWGKPPGQPKTTPCREPKKTRGRGAATARGRIGRVAPPFLFLSGPRVIPPQRLSLVVGRQYKKSALLPSFAVQGLHSGLVRTQDGSK